MSEGPNPFGAFMPQPAQVSWGSGAFPAPFEGDTSASPGQVDEAPVAADVTPGLTSKRPADVAAPEGEETVPGPAPVADDLSLESIFGDLSDATEAVAPAATAKPASADAGSATDDLFDLFSDLDVPAAEPVADEAASPVSGPADPENGIDEQESAEQESEATEASADTTAASTGRRAKRGGKHRRAGSDDRVTDAELETAATTAPAEPEREPAAPKVATGADLDPAAAPASPAPASPAPADTEPTGAAQQGAPVAAPEERRLAPVAALRGELSAAELAELEKVNAAVAANRRYSAANALYPHVDAILGLIQSDPVLQAERHKLSVTQDTAKWAAQVHRLREKARTRMADKNMPVMNPADIPLIFEMVYDDLVGLGPMGPFFRDPEVTEIMVDSWDRIVVERNGSLVVTPAKFRSPEHASTVAQNMSELVSDRRVTNTNPIVTAELPDSRVQFAYGNIVASGLSVTMRKFRALLGMDALLKFGSLTPEMADFLANMVAGRANILVSGGTGTGKTTLINALSGFIPDSERVITIENAFELQLSNTHWLALRTKEAASADDSTRVSQADLLVSTLRMRPDRIVVGEIREPAEATVMLTAANTGHDGTMTTIHANDASRAVRRMVNLVRTDTGMSDDVALLEVASAIDLIVQVTRRAGKRFVSSISVLDADADGRVVPYDIYQGVLRADGQPQFRRSGSLRSDTDLAAKVIDSGIDLTRWG